MDLIKIAEEAFATGKQHPSFKAGDTITVAYRIVISCLLHIYTSILKLLLMLLCISIIYIL